MSTQVLLTPKVWFGGYDLSADLSAAAFDGSTPPIDFTNFASAGNYEGKPGIRKTAFSMAGFFNAQPTDEQLQAALSLTAIPASFAPLTGVEGEPAYSMQCNLATYAPGAPVGEAFKFSASGDGTGPLVRGTILNNAARITTGSGTIFQLGAVGAAQGIYAALHVVAVAGGTPTLAVILQSASTGGFGSPTTRLTFTSATGITSEWKQALGAITDQYWRLSWTIGGSSPSFTVVDVAGII